MVVAPFVKVGFKGEIVIVVSTGAAAETVAVVVEVNAPAEAVIVVVPADTPVNTPVFISIVPTAGTELVQVVVVAKSAPY